MSDYVPAVRELRDRLGLTQEDFARALGMSVSTVCRWEKGQSKPSKLAYMSIVRAAGLRGVDVSSLTASAS